MVVVVVVVVVVPADAVGSSKLVVEVVMVIVVVVVVLTLAVAVVVVIVVVVVVVVGEVIVEAVLAVAAAAAVAVAVGRSTTVADKQWQDQGRNDVEEHIHGSQLITCAVSFVCLLVTLRSQLLHIRAPFFLVRLNCTTRRRLGIAASAGSGSRRCSSNGQRDASA